MYFWLRSYEIKGTWHTITSNTLRSSPLDTNDANFIIIKIEFVNRIMIRKCFIG